jgi:lipid-binding SYLF domain-containing protein
MAEQICFYLTGKKKYMKKSISVSVLKFSLLLLVLLTGVFAHAQSSKDQKLIRDSRDAKEDFIHTDGLMQNLFSSSYGYVIFPNVGKGGMGIGGAAGNGILYENGNAIGKAKMTQVSIGFQFGGQAYREVIFFESQSDLNRFKENRFEFSAQASAVAVTAGVSANVKYRDGVMIFTQQKGGLMYEASIGGQKFDYTGF